MLRKIAIGIAAAAIICYLLSGVLLGAMGSYLVNARPPVKADLAVVLAGDGTGRRILRAAELVRAGYAPQVLVSGPNGNYGLHECDLAIPFALKAGFPESYFIHQENSARSTREEARIIATEARRRGAHKILVVTSDYHTRRTARMYAQEVPDLEVVVVAAPDANFTADGWWRSREGQKTAFYEWTKTVTSWVGM